jgi:hypothetical protein
MMGIGVDRDQVEGAVTWHTPKKAGKLLYFNHLNVKDDVKHQLIQKRDKSVLLI